LTLKRDYAEAWRIRALALSQLDQPKTVSRASIGRSPWRRIFAEALIDRATVLMQFHRYAEALASQDRALALRPTDVVSSTTGRTC